MTRKETNERRPYLQVFVLLAVLTAVEVGVASLITDSGARIAVLLALAVTKAALVALFYMHLRYDQRILAIIGGFPILLVVIMLIILLSDRSLAG